jgi:cytidyltransferase-like protein
MYINRNIRSVLYCGRFQPFHNGHLSAIQEAVETFSEPLIVGVIINTVLSHSSLPQDAWTLAQIGDERQVAALNPMPLLDRLEVIADVMNEAGLSNKIRLIPMPRPESYWELVIAMVPGPRTWLLPDSQDPFELGKKEFFLSRGDTVSLLKKWTSVSGTGVRELLANGDRRVEDQVPKAVLEYFKSRSNSKTLDE